MSYRPRGQYVQIDENSPEALGVCDYTGFIFKRKDLVRQMEWRGNRLAWTGFYVGKPFVDQPNAQLKPPILKPDPVPVRQPRLEQFSAQTWDQMGNAAWEYQSTPWQMWGGYQSDMAALPEAQRQSLLEQVYFGAF